MRWRIASIVLPILFGCLIAGAAAMAARVAAGPQRPQPTRDSLTDQQRAAIVHQARERNARYLRASRRPMLSACWAMLIFSPPLGAGSNGNAVTGSARVRGGEGTGTVRSSPQWGTGALRCRAGRVPCPRRIRCTERRNRGGADAVQRAESRSAPSRLTRSPSATSTRNSRREGRWPDGIVQASAGRLSEPVTVGCGSGRSRWLGEGRSCRRRRRRGWRRGNYGRFAAPRPVGQVLT